MNSLVRQDGTDDRADGGSDGGARDRAGGGTGAGPSGERYRREDLAAAAGVKVRNLRYYQERGLLPPPRREGRIAWYSADHLTRLRLISDLLGRGYTVNGIAELLHAWEAGGGLSQLLGLERAMTRDWVQEEPVTMTLAELRELFGPAATAEDTRRAAQLGYVRIEGDRVTHRSGRLLEATLTLVRQGVPLAEILDAGDFVQTQAAALADRFVGLFRRHVIGPDGLEQLSASQLDHISDAAGVLRPVAGEVVAAEFARAMARRMETEVAELLRKDAEEAVTDQ
ncbi:MULTISPECIES: MerR family transcriptional regulator [unclassified Streptomyces]|uniref:MerR family transcriptional regulator n=1 Tax=unclassified Streptomyces TaxID=2593676 RepID=UPI000A9BC991|nr:MULTISPECIES: MerR family transcriptional regulator [unclassified Streptomyces]TDU74755.1 MerR-like DNA binding protein [Streptomyces sp. KS 21]